MKKIKYISSVRYMKNNLKPFMTITGGKIIDYKIRHK